MKLMKILFFSTILLIINISSVQADPSAWTAMTAKTTAETDLKEKVIKVMNDYYDQYHRLEYFSGMSVAIYAPGHGIQSFYLGRTSHNSDSKKIDQNTLFDIGSITKSFTGAIILQLEKQNLLKLNDKVGKWLPEYSKWGDITIEQLLNMTSGLPNYSNSPTMNYKVTQNLSAVWSNKELVDIVYPPRNLNPPLETGYDYTNTGYLLAAMIAEKASKHSYNDLLGALIKQAGLQNTFYPVPKMSDAVKNRMAHGYSFNPYDNPELLGKDISENNLSWAGAAGGIVANSADIIHWVNELFVENKILDFQQKKQLESMVSLATGKPIDQVDSNNPEGFGLGVVEQYMPSIGKFWVYEGETLGFRAIYIYVPCNGVVIAANLNSAVYSKNDNVKVLMQNLYKAALSAYNISSCK